MNEDLLIENSNREEVSRLKNSISGYVKKWPYLVLSIVICVATAFVLLKFKQDSYKVTSKVLIKKSQQVTDPSELLFGGRNVNSRFGGVGDEMVVFQSFPLIKAALEQLKFDVVYKVDKGWNEVEIYNQSPIVFDFNREENGDVPYSTKFSIEILDEVNFQLTAENKSGGKRIDGKYSFDELIDLDGFEFRISRNLQNWNVNETSKTVAVYLKSLTKETYSYKGRMDFESGEGMSKLLTLSLTSTTPQKSIDFINALIEKYIDENLLEKNKVSQNTVDFIDSQLAVISDSLTIKEENLESFKSTKELSSLSVDGESIITKFNEIETEKAQYEVMQQYYDYLMSNIKKGNETNLQNLIAPSAFGITDEIINSLVNSLIELNISKSQLIKNGNDKNPMLEQIDNRINEITENLQESINNLSNANQIILNTMNSRSQKVISQAKNLPNTERKLVNLNRLLKLNENIYLFLMEKRSSAAIALSSNTPDAQVIEPAMLNPLSPVAPNKKMYYLVAIVIGIIVPMIVFIGIDFLDDKIRDKQDVISATNIPIMGVIPNSKHIENNKIVFNQPKSALAEAFRTIRTNLTFFQKSSEPFVIMVTSTVASEGKTFCAINLAASLAASGKKTILLGFDLRKPQIHNYLNVENTSGVSNYLSGKVELKDIIVRSNEPNLSIISSGPIPPNPAELITTTKTSDLIDALKKEFDYIVLDTPPIGLVADALLLQRQSDLNLYIVRQGYSKREFLNQANDLYSLAKLVNLSLIVNDVDKGGSYNYGYYED